MSDRFALIIANSEFDDPKLSLLVTPSRDAEALAKVLSDPNIGGFKVTLLVNETEPVVRRKVAYLYHRRKRDDLLLLYYSGHGIRDEHSGALYLATRDTQMDIASATALEAAFVCGQIDTSSSQRKVVILDCCHSGAFAGAKAVVGSSAGTREAFAGSGYGWVILAASNAVQYAWEGDKLLGEAETSVFTHFLVQGLQTGAADLDNDGQISLDELYDYVYEQVITSGLSKQTPQKWAQKVEGRIIIARNPAPPVPKVSLPDWITEALASGDVAARLAAVGKLDQLSRGEDQALAAIACAELERLRQEDENSIVCAAAAGALGISPVAVSTKPSPALPVEVKKPPAEPEPEPELHPSLALKLSVKPETVDAGGKAIWTVTLRNDGDDDLRHVTVRRGRTLLGEPFDLAIGKERHFTFTSTYRTKGKKTVRIIATGTANGEGVRSKASMSVQVRPPRPVTPKPEPAPKPQPPAKPAPNVLTITSPIHLELVRVPAGEFLMGSDPAKDKDAQADEQPQHRVYVSEFYIGKYPVTNAQYAAFVKATKHKVPEHWKRFLAKAKVPSGKENHPVFNISWDDAVAFCKWLSRETSQPFRLPTEAEWEKAARGTDGRIYPWGNEWDPNRCNNWEWWFNRTPWPISEFWREKEDTTPVGTFSPQGDSPYGCADMAGNVREWCVDRFDEQEYQRRAKSTVKDPQGPEKYGFNVVRGGSCADARYYARCASRHPGLYSPPGFKQSKKRYLSESYGFRVVMAPALLKPAAKPSQRSPTDKLAKGAPSMICPHCGNRISPTARFCTNCGADLNLWVVMPPPPVKRAPSMSCPHCGNPILPTDRFCHNCGADL